MKQETLEEAAIDYCDRFFGKDRTTHHWNDGYTTFINSAKWQQEQDKNKYSEENIKKAYCDGSNLDYNIMISTKEGSEMLNKWFEQFKKA